MLAFALSGLLAGVAGIMIIAQAGAASSFGLGSDLLLPGIAAAIVGGTAITGGVANPLNVVFGALTITLIPIGAATVGVPPQAQSLVYGLVIIIAVALTRGRSSGEIVRIGLTARRGCRDTSVGRWFPPPHGAPPAPGRARCLHRQVEYDRVPRPGVRSSSEQEGAHG